MTIRSAARVALIIVCVAVGLAVALAIAHGKTAVSAVSAVALYPVLKNLRVLGSVRD